jgi:phosphopantothenoylcysteine decarboxylase/phosphopantothenate--cysteine ligase
MNENMYQNRIVQTNIKKLKTLGYRFVGPAKGRLTCGKEGMGCLAGTEEIIKAVKSLI